MMIILVLCVVVLSSEAVPIPDESQSKTIQFEHTNDGSGNYIFSFDTSNGMARSETGTLVNAGEADEHIEVQGYYSYIDTDGKTVYVYYKADENGFQILPGPPVPLVPMVVQSLPASVTATLLG